MNLIIELARCVHCDAAARLDSYKRCPDCTADIQRWIAKYGWREDMWNELQKTLRPSAIRMDIP